MPPELGALERQLADVVGVAHVHAGAAAAAFAVDGVVPRLVVQPDSQEQVERLVLACAGAGAAVGCRGGGTAIRLGNPPTRLDVVVCLERLNRIVELDEANLNVSVEAGVRLADLQAAVSARREFLPLDPPQPERITVGGIVAANASGPSRLLYGTVRDWVLGLRVVLPTGERIRCGGKVIKNVSGYDMNKLFIGSMGTLGIVTEATFKLLPAPAMRATVAGAFSELTQVAAVVSRTLSSHLLPEAMEALDAQALRAVEPALGVGAARYGLAVSVAGSPETVERQVRDFNRFFSDAQAIATATLDDVRGRTAWRAMQDVHARLGGTSDDTVVLKIAVPIARTLELFSAAEALARGKALSGAVTAHAGSGIVRAGLLAREGAVGTLRDGIEELRRQAEGAEGSLVVESAPLMLKKQPLDAWGRARDAFSVMRRMKAEFDPRGLMSPGRFIGGI